MNTHDANASEFDVRGRLLGRADDRPIEDLASPPAGFDATTGDQALPVELKPVPRVRRLENQWSAVALVGIITMASLFRLTGIADVGIRFDDEGAYVGDARLWHRCAETLLDAEAIRAVRRHDKQAFQARLEAHGVDFGARYLKPSQGYTFLGALAMFVFGDRPAALLVLNALCGILTVAVVYAIGVTLFNRPIALFAALLLAVSPYHLLYSRSAWAESTACLFVALGVLAWVRGIARARPAWRTYGLAGLWLGYAATCHYRSLYVAGVLVITAALATSWHDIRSRGPFRSAARAAGCWLWFGVGLALPAMLIQSVFVAARAAAAASDSYLPLSTYFAAWSQWMSKVSEWCRIDGVRTAGLFGVSGVAFLSYLLERCGAVAFALTSVGLVAGLLRPKLGRLPALLVLVIFALLWNQPYMVARALSTALPAICLCAALGLAVLVRIVRGHPRVQAGVVTAVLVLTIVPNARASLRLCSERSSIADACEFLASQGPGVAFVLDTYHHSKYWLYLEGSGVEVRTRPPWRNADPPAQFVARLRSEGVRWFIMDPQRWHFRSAPPGRIDRVFDHWQHVNDYLTGEVYLAADFPHLSGFCREFLAEGPGTAYVDDMIASQAGRLRVYDLGAAGRSNTIRDRIGTQARIRNDGHFTP